MEITVGRAKESSASIFEVSFGLGFSAGLLVDGVSNDVIDAELRFFFPFCLMRFFGGSFSIF